MFAAVSENYSELKELEESGKKERRSHSAALTNYRDRNFAGTRAEQEMKLRTSTTLYVGNLSYFTSEEQMQELFQRCGEVKQIVMGVDRFKKTPCGFAFVQFETRESATAAMRFVNGTRLDNRVIRCDWDAGFVDGRQFGRGRSGGQVRDEFRQDYDSGRGGWGQIVSAKKPAPFAPAAALEEIPCIQPGISNSRAL